MASEADFLCLFQVRNKCLHTVCAVLPHLVCDMTVNVQSESSGSVSQVALNGFDIVTVLQGCDRVAVAQIVKPSFGNPHTGGNLFEVCSDRILGKVSSEFIGENQISNTGRVFTFPCLTSK